MHIVIAPDKFAGTLSAPEAARAMADGWTSVHSQTNVDIVPLSDGGPGFVEVMGEALDATTVTVEVTDPLGRPVSAQFALLDTEEGTTAYIESAQACGLHLLEEYQRDPERASSYGVGQLIASAVDHGATTIVVGLGGSATNDGGAGLLAALGATPRPALSRGGAGLASLRGSVDLEPARSAVGAVRLVAATDVDNPLLGAHGATRVFGPQKGADARAVERLEADLVRWADATDPDRRLRDTAGAGAAGGLGYALLLLGGRVESGVELVLDAVQLDRRVAAADLVLTGEGSFDSQSLRGKLPHGVARMATAHEVDCLVLAGRVTVDPAEAEKAGISTTYSLVESAGSVELALAESATQLTRLAARVATERGTKSAQDTATEESFGTTPG
ncbi:glycerate kinase [Spiractinospora alimapuensis]|uniref:glycerate kinase family protein n=1 Tax=Spiractinospora alimapuensis TaxID=2820884 RepID=UPI001F3A0A6D|nr:glycerate kinase [Spiractinospora alimapuensis]QVQ53246.1 glycerate kinase [Spiractinospora alimapuensis]